MTTFGFLPLIFYIPGLFKNWNKYRISLNDVVYF